MTALRRSDWAVRRPQLAGQRPVKRSLTPDRRGSLDLRLLRHFQRIIDPRFPGTALSSLLSPSSSWTAPKFFGAPINQRGFCASQRVRSIRGGIKAYLAHSASNDSGVLTGREIDGCAGATLEQEILAPQSLTPNPRSQCVTRVLGDFELNRPLRLLLHDNGACCDTFSMHDIPDVQLHEIALSQFAVDSQIEHCQFASAVVELQANSDCPDLLEA